MKLVILQIITFALFAACIYEIATMGEKMMIKGFLCGFAAWFLVAVLLAG